MLFGALLVAIVAYAGWSANRTAVVRERQLVENALDQSVSRVLDQQKAIAWWDDAVIAAQARPLDIEWLETNFGVYFHETYGHDEIIIVDGQNRPIYANVERRAERRGAGLRQPSRRARSDRRRSAPAAPTARLRRRDRAFVESQGNYSALLGASFGRWAGHIMSVDGEPAVVAALSIVPNLDANLLQGEPHLLLSVVQDRRGLHGRSRRLAADAGSHASRSDASAPAASLVRSLRRRRWRAGRLSHLDAAPPGPHAAAVHSAAGRARRDRRRVR